MLEWPDPGRMLMHRGQSGKSQFLMGVFLMNAELLRRTGSLAQDLIQRGLQVGASGKWKDPAVGDDIVQRLAAKMLLQNGGDDGAAQPFDFPARLHLNNSPVNQLKAGDVESSA